jgi:hypothetical protein
MRDYQLVDSMMVACTNTVDLKVAGSAASENWCVLKTDYVKGPIRGKAEMANLMKFTWSCKDELKHLVLTN